MAKHIRKTGEYDHNEGWNRWYEWQKANADLMKDLNFDSDSINKIATETGREVAEVYAERSKAYYEVREEFQRSEYERQAVGAQHLIIRNNSLDSACSIYQKADRILTNLPVQVFLNDDPASAPAHNDGKNVTFNATQIKSLDDETVRSLHGLNYHELAHLLYTPRIGTALGKWVMEKTTTVAKQTSHRYNHETQQPEAFEWDYEVEALVEQRRLLAFNILEDCRAERLLTIKYPSVKPFLTATVADYIADHADRLADSFILLAGRMYLDRELRALSALLYAQKHGEDRARAIYELTAEYRKLIFPRDYTRAQELITTLVNLLPEGAGAPDPHGCHPRPMMRNGKPQSEKAQQEIDQQDNEDSVSPFPEVGTEGDTNTGEIDKDHAHFNEVAKELVDKAQAVAELAKADNQLQKKVRDTVGAIARDNSTKSILGQSRFTRAEPEQREVTASRLFAQELERLRIDCDPLWIQDKPTGKLNVAKAMNADINDINKLFNRWEMGNDDYQIEACILMDRSGSMWSEIGAVCRSAWAIKRAIEKINGRVSVMTFSDTSRSLASADVKAKANEVLMVESAGGTDPDFALKESERIMGLSTAKTKLVFVLTDGMFNSTADKSIKALRDNGVFTSIVFLGNSDWLDKIKNDPQQIANLQHGANDLQFIGNPNDLVKVAKGVVRHNIKGAR
jgi:hypothetical protein